MSLLTHIHGYLRTARQRLHIESDAPLPESKRYERMEKVKLPNPLPLDMTLSKALSERRSCRRPSFAHGTTGQEIRSLLLHALGPSAKGSRTYPSGGARYPVETYFIAHRIEGLPRAIFHYRPESDELEKLWNMPEDAEFSKLLAGTEWEALAAGAVVFTGLWERSAEKYQDFAYYLTLIEAGHMAQNVLLCAAALGLCACPKAAFSDSGLSKALDLDPDREAPVYALIVGKSVS